MACPLALILAATVLTVPTGNKVLANAAGTSPAGEAFWRAALPGAPMPEAIRELLHHPHADKKQQATVLNDDATPRDGGDDPPPMNFSYDDYRAASRRNENAEALLKHGGGNAACSSPPTVTLLFLEDAPGAGLDRTVRAASEGSSFVVTYVCHATTSGPERATTAAGNDDSPVSP